jgi:hypothetical protein
LSELEKRIAQHIADESREMPDDSAYVAQSVPLAGFRMLVQEFAVDGLTEAQAFYYVLPRLMLRIMIDEFGSGNLKRAHTTLYLELLRELDISGDDIQSGGTSDSWKHAYLPIEQPIEVEAGDHLKLVFSRAYPDAGGRFRQVYRWRGEVKRKGQTIGRFDQCMNEAEIGTA